MNYKSINDQFRETAQDIRGNIPHLVIGKQGLNTNQNNNPICPYCKRPFNQIYQNKPVNIQEKDYTNTFNKIRNWGLWIVISLVIGYAAYRLLSFLF